MRNETAKKIKLFVLIAALALLVGPVACRSTKQNLNRAAQDAGPAATDTQTAESPFNIVDSKVIERQSPFDHNRPEHQTKTKDCMFCHQRPDNATTFDFNKHGPGHKACKECHQKDFTNPASKMCEVCHTTPVDQTGTVIKFPTRLDQFGIKKFSHKDHMDPQKMKDQSAQGLPKCDDCHKFEGAGIQASFPKHPNCFGCHAHEAGGKISACDVCHTPKAQAVAYQTGPGTALTLYNFKHGPHIKKAECSRCHQTIDVPKEEMRSDILEINVSRGQRHHSTCWTCHVQAKEPNCFKCHISSSPF